MEIFDIAYYILARNNAKKEEIKMANEINKQTAYMNSVLMATQISKLFNKNDKLLTYDEVFNQNQDNIDNLSLLRERRNRKKKEHKL